MLESTNNIPLITLTTDWGQHDYYLGMLKGSLLSSMPQLKVVDISHDVASFNIHNAAFVVKNSFSFFPKGSIHLIMVNSEASVTSRILICKWQEHYFVTPDNGTIGLLITDTPEEVHEVPFAPEGSFASLSAYVKAVQNILANNLGEKITDYDKRIAFKATIDESVITGSIIYIDSYQNAITNISRSIFERVRQNRDYNIFVQSNHNKISKLSTSYNQVDAGELLALFNSANLLEIAIRNGYAAELLSLRVGGSVRINFI